MKARRTDLVARVLFWTALAVFGLFQGLPFDWYSAATGNMEVEYYGWEFWGLFPRVMRELDGLDPILVVFLCCFILSVLLVLLGPFSVGILSRSRVLWWAAALASGLVACGLSGLFGYHYVLTPLIWNASAPGPGAVALASYPLLIFLGVMWTRKRVDDSRPQAGMTEAADR